MGEKRSKVVWAKKKKKRKRNYHGKKKQINSRRDVFGPFGAKLRPTAVFLDPFADGAREPAESEVRGSQTHSSAPGLLKLLEPVHLAGAPGSSWPTVT